LYVLSKKTLRDYYALYFAGLTQMALLVLPIGSAGKARPRRFRRQDKRKRKVLYCVANRRKEAPEKPYTIGEAVEYIGNLGGPRRAPSDGPPGVKTIWRGLQKFYTLYDYREMFDFMGQV
jgi:hypothetical protein